MISTTTRDDVSALSGQSLSVGYMEHKVIENLMLDIEHRQITTLVGPNGSGKSTLLKSLARLLKPSNGVVLLNGKSITSQSTAQVAQQLAILPQSPSSPYGLTVRELVEQGRYPHVGALRMLRQQDHHAIDEALALTSMTEFANRPVDSLSGGERQRAWIALTLAQDTPILLLDEPTTFLDIGHQIEILDLVQRLNLERGMTIVLVLHDLNQAARYANRMVVLNRGQIVADSDPHSVLTPELLAEVFGVHVNIILDPITGTPICLPYASAFRDKTRHPTTERILENDLSPIEALPHA